MCFGDMTTIKEYWINDRQRMMADFDNVHTCRDFSALKDWARRRDADDDERWPENAARVLAGANRS
jgi:Mycotoxin biosynthesis protein UstYa